MTAKEAIDIYYTHGQAVLEQVVEGEKVMLATSDNKCQPKICPHCNDTNRVVRYRVGCVVMMGSCPHCGGKLRANPPAKVQ